MMAGVCPDESVCLCGCSLHVGPKLLGLQADHWSASETTVVLFTAVNLSCLVIV